MVLDSLQNSAKYASLHPAFKQACDFVKNTDWSKMEPGKTMLNGKDLFVNYSIAKGKTKEEAKIESHNNMIDIQIPLSCPETMGYTARKDLPEEEYNEVKDITFYKGLAKDYVTIFPGSFVIFFPEDGHAPCISDEKEIKKVIFKVRV